MWGGTRSRPRAAARPDTRRATEHHRGDHTRAFADVRVSFQAGVRIVFCAAPTRRWREGSRALRQEFVAHRSSCRTECKPLAEQGACDLQKKTRGGTGCLQKAEAGGFRGARGSETAISEATERTRGARGGQWEPAAASAFAQDGWTLMETMVVTSIIAILSAIAIPQFSALSVRCRPGRPRTSCSATSSTPVP